MNKEERERTPREEMVVQTIQVAAFAVIAIAAPLIERAMSDPDIGFYVRWHMRRFEHKFERRMHELGIAIESTIGLYFIEEHLRQQWKDKHADKA